MRRYLNGINFRNKIVDDHVFVSTYSQTVYITQPPIYHMSSNLKTMQPVTPAKMFQQLMATSFQEQQCIQENSQYNIRNVTMKESLKQEVRNLQKSKLQITQLIQQRKQLKETLKEILNYRQAIDYDHKYKTIKFDHYNFPYKNNQAIKNQLNNQRMENADKRRKINELQQEIKRKEAIVQGHQTKRQQFQISQIAHIPTRDNQRSRQDKFWLDRIEGIKNRYLNQSQDYKRAKIRHDYNLFIQRSGCLCVGLKVCPICSDLNLETKSNTYTREALLSPRYKPIYRR